MKLMSLVLVALFSVSTPAFAQRAACSEIRSNGEICLGNAAKFGKRGGNKTVITPDTLQILGSGSTGDVSEMSLRVPGFGAVARSLLARFDENVELSDFGWDKTGNTDCGPALRAAGAKLGARGGRISIGAGKCWVDSPVEFTRAVEIEGQGYTEGPGTGSPGGTQILISRAGFVPFTFSGVNARGATVRNLAVRQIQPNLTGTTWAPTDYDYVFKVLGTLGIVTFDNILFQGVTRGIYANNSGRLHIPTLKGQFYVAGVEIDNAYDIPRIGYVHAWPFATSDARVMKWQQDNLDTIILRKVDGIYLGDIFTFSDRSSIYLTSGANGVTTKAYISNLYSDLSRYGIRIDGPGTAFQAANVTTQNNDYNHGATPLSESAGLLIDTTNVTAQIGNWRTDLVESSAIKVNQTGNRVQMTSLRVGGFNRLGDNSPAVSVSAGSTVEIAHPPILVNGGTGPVFGGGGNFQRMVGMNVPAGSVNELRCYASIAGTPTGCLPIGSDASIDLLLGSKGPSGSTRIQSGGQTVLRTDNPSSGNSNVLLRSGTGAVSVVVESPSANSDLSIASKGSTGSVRLQSNGVTVLRTDSPAAGDSAAIVRSGTGAVSVVTESASANATLALNAKGNSGVLTSAFIRTADPTTADIPAGRCADWNNTTAGTYKRVCNFDGTLRSATMN